jgi:hypothetical protein
MRRIPEPVVEALEDASLEDGGLSLDGRGGFRTCDLSRVKRDDNDGETGNSMALHWGVARV